MVKEVIASRFNEYSIFWNPPCTTFFYGHHPSSPEVSKGKMKTKFIMTVYSGNCYNNSIAINNYGVDGHSL